MTPSVEEIIMAALQVVHSRMWSENHPEDPHRGDSVDMAEELLEQELHRWRRAWGA